MYGQRGDLKAKILSIELKSETPSILEGANLLLLMNNARVDYNTDFLEPQILRYTSYHWVPISNRNPTTTVYTMERGRLLSPQPNYQKILGIEAE